MRCDFGCTDKDGCYDEERCYDNENFKETCTSDNVAISCGGENAIASQCTDQKPCVIEESPNEYIPSPTCAELCNEGDSDKIVCSFTESLPKVTTLKCKKTTSGKFAYFASEASKYCAYRCEDGVGCLPRGH